MSKVCPECQQVFPEFVDYCVADGARLEIASVQDGDGELREEEPITSELRASPSEDRPEAIPGRARLFPRVHGVTQAYGVEFFGDVVLGRFDPEVGAVDVDLSDVPGSHFISPRHARLTFDEGQWWVDDLESENGVFVDRGARITERVALGSGQELALGNALFLFETDQPSDVTAPLEGND